MRKPFIFSVNKPDYHRSVEITGWRSTDSGGCDIMTADITVKRYSAEESNTAPLPGAFLKLLPDDAQNLVDALWDAGFKPTQGHGSTGQLAAVQAHLADTQVMLNKTLDAVIDQLPKKRKKP